MGLLALQAVKDEPCGAARGAVFLGQRDELREDEGAFPAIAAQDVLAAPQDTHEGRTRDPAYVGRTTFGARGHENTGKR